MELITGSTSCRSLTMGREVAGKDWLITTVGGENQTNPTLTITGPLLSLKMLGIRPHKVLKVRKLLSFLFSGCLEFSISLKSSHC